MPFDEARTTVRFSVDQIARLVRARSAACAIRGLVGNRRHPDCLIVPELGSVPRVQE